MRRIVFDIETLGVDFSDLDLVSQEYFMKFADTPQKKEEVMASTSFFPLTAEIIAIAMTDADREEGVVCYQDGEKHSAKFEDSGIKFIPGSEVDILNHFWMIAQQCDQLITFNGRVFDGPFIMLRSAIHRIRTRKNLIPYRYSPSFHVDLADQMTFYDAMRRRFSLHMWCKAFNIPSPKENGITGLMVKELFSSGRYQDIARYCLDDVVATKKLHEYWEKYLKF